MITRAEANEAKKRAGKMLTEAGIKFTEAELDRMDVADFGLSWQLKGRRFYPCLKLRR